MFEGLGILLVFNLLKGFVGILVEFEFYDVDIVLRLDEQIDAAIAGVMFHFCV